MNCPRCDVNMKCDCSACTSNPKNDNIPGVLMSGDRKKDTIACGNCGLEAHIDEWEELSYFNYDEERSRVQTGLREGSAVS